jgi:hypothetical protein
METLWFWLVAFSIAMFVVFDGFDIGAGILHLLVARTDDERARMFRVIGPVWDGNEVWLLAAGGTLVFAFPGLYAASFSGFYLPLMIVLWLLILRHLDRIPESRQEPALAAHVGRRLFRVEHDARGLFRRGARQRGARSPTQRRRLFFPSAVGELPRRQRPSASSIGTRSLWALLHCLP